MQLRQNQKIFVQFFSAFKKSAWNLGYFERDDDPQRLSVFEIVDGKKRSYWHVQKDPCQNTYPQSTC